jgi:hypothetical protein
MKKLLWGILLFLPLIILSCKKNGTGGEHELSVSVKHHEQLIPGATVYIKYGAKEFPGSDVSKYNDSRVCGITGHARGHVHFDKLLKGDYYLYAVGYDSTISMPVKGGVPVQLKKKHSHTDVTVPVVE